MDHPRRYWMWAKRKSQWMESWEEAAFAEDASRGPEGCVWPQRCYTCSFCKREFRSAQALGGHMNVHRRDRARLKQSTTEEDVPHVIRVSSLPPVPKVMVVGEEKPVTAHDHGVVPSCKKRVRTDGKHTCFDVINPQLEVMKHCSSPVEDLDLELRLGEAPKLK